MSLFIHLVYKGDMKADRMELALNWPSAFVLPGDFLPRGRKNIIVKLENKSIEALRESLGNPLLQCTINVYL